MKEYTFMTSVTLNVPDISCEHCQRAITTALSPVEGVSAVQVDIQAKQVCVTYDPALVDLDRMQAILEDEDYPVASVI
jgi:copper chaperone